MSVIPPIQLYQGAGQPYKTANQNQINNRNAHNSLNNKYGGNGQKITVPQAPTAGMVAAGPHTGNSLSKGMSQTLVNAHAQRQYDNLAGKPAPTSQGGGSLLRRLERMVNGKSRKKKKTRGGSKYKKRKNRQKTKKKK
jgi:hypothetical protein